jgi:Na+(H+)/acetate symporter ActP
MIGGVGGDLLGALVAGGAFAAFLSTSSGLTVSVAGVISQDLLARVMSPVSGFRIACVASVLVPLGAALMTERLSVASAVTLAFAVAASTFCPLLVLGIWWPRLSSVGAGGRPRGWRPGLRVGVLVTMLSGTGTGWTGALLSQPAAWSVPLGFAVMIVVSLLTPGSVAPNVARTMGPRCTPPSRSRSTAAAGVRATPEPLVVPQRPFGAGRRTARRRSSHVRRQRRWKGCRRVARSLP